MTGDLFSGLDLGQPPIDASTFKQRIVQEYADSADDTGIRACIGAAVDDVWPAPGYREHQRDAVVDVLESLYVDDNSVVTLSAPTGAGKSLILHAAMAVVASVFGRQSFFTTPLNSLIDQVDDDEFIADDVLTVKGRNNYTCKHPQDKGASVDNAICQRASSFDCEYKDRSHENGGCSYYGRLVSAQSHPEVVTNLSYLMANSMIPDTVDKKLDPRELMVIDECQSIEDFALQFVTVTVSDTVVPEVVFDRVEQPPHTDDVEQLAEWLQTEVVPPVRDELSELETKADTMELTEDESDMLEDLQQFDRKCQNLLSDIEDHHWTVSKDIESSTDWNVEFKPVFVGRFLDTFLWSQGNKYILSSATIPKSGFLEEIGLDDKDVGEVEVPSTFPTERRPVYTDCDVGKMTMGERDTTIPKMARKIADIANHHNDGTPHRGFVHCHSYKIAQRLYDNLPHDVKLRTRVQDGSNREQSLDDWLDADVDEEGYSDERGGQVFLSVGMEEGISLDDWRARWQVIAKASYPFLGEERVSYRMDELDDWNWYAGTAAIALQQAVGRGMRSKDDWCHTYVLDTSVKQLIERNGHLLEDWFTAAVDETVTDELPDRYE